MKEVENTNSAVDVNPQAHEQLFSDSPKFGDFDSNCAGNMFLLWDGARICLTSKARFVRWEDGAIVAG